VEWCRWHDRLNEDNIQIAARSGFLAMADQTINSSTATIGYSAAEDSSARPQADDLAARYPPPRHLEELHGVFQVVMGWQSSHLYRFRIHAAHYGSWEFGDAVARTIPRHVT
jgi:hypothetical protein